MKVVLFHGPAPVVHPLAGELVPGPNEIHDDALAEQLLAAGRFSGQFSEGLSRAEVLAAEEASFAAEALEPPEQVSRRRRSRAVDTIDEGSEE